MTEWLPPTDDSVFSSDSNCLPIREVARQTGVNPITLRAWERRYGLIQPTRTPSGHRLYSTGEVARIQQIQRWIQRGVPVGKVADLLDQTPVSVGLETARASSLPALHHWKMRLLTAIQRFDEPRVQQIYGELLSLWPIEALLSDLCLPLWRDLQRDESFGWRSYWRFWDDFLCLRLRWRLQLASSQQGSAPVLLMAALPELSRELELLTAGIQLGLDAGLLRLLTWSPPLEELRLLCDQMTPSAVLLHASCALTREHQRQLERFAHGLACPVALMGEGAMLVDSASMPSFGCMSAGGSAVRHWLKNALG